MKLQKINYLKFMDVTILPLYKKIRPRNLTFDGEIIN
jgi:hypothetical protein